jgi:hypothetical protein
MDAFPVEGEEAIPMKGSWDRGPQGLALHSYAAHLQHTRFCLCIYFYYMQRLPFEHRSC